MILTKLNPAKLVRCTAGATAVEFALLAPIFFMLLFGMIEFGRAYWMRQTLEEVAFHTARCMAMDSRCATEEDTEEFAVERAQAYSVALIADDVETDSNVTCRTRANSHEVELSIPFNSVLNGFGVAPERLSAEACFPVFG